MICTFDEASVIEGLYSTDPTERLNAVMAALAFGFDSVELGVAIQYAILHEDDGYLGPAIINGALQVAGNVGAKHGGMNDFIVGVLENPPQLPYVYQDAECEPIPLDENGVPIDGQTSPECTPVTMTSSLDALENTASIKTAAVDALVIVNEAEVIPESTMDSVIDDLENELDGLVDDEDGTVDQKLKKVKGHAASVHKLGSRVSKKAKKQRRNRMGNKLRMKFHSHGKKRLGCPAAAFMGDIIKDMGDDAPPLDPNEPIENDILEVMDNCGDSVSNPTISINCPSEMSAVGSVIDFSPTITNAKAEIIILGGVVVGSLDRIDITVDFGDGISGSVDDFSHAYSDPGSYAFTVSVTDNVYGLSSIETCYVSVYLPVPVSIGDPVPPTASPGDTVIIPIITDDDIWVLLDPPVLISPPGGEIEVVVPYPPDVIIIEFEDAEHNPTEPAIIYPPVIIVYEPLEVELSTDDVSCAGSDKEFTAMVSGAMDGYSLVWHVDGLDEIGESILVKSFEAGRHVVSVSVTDSVDRTITTEPIEFEIFEPYEASLVTTSVPTGPGVLPGLTINVDVCVSLCDGNKKVGPPTITIKDSGGNDVPVVPVVQPGPPYIYIIDPPGPYVICADMEPGITACTDIVVYGPPIISLEHTLSKICHGLVTFTINVSGGNPQLNEIGNGIYNITLNSGDGTVYQITNGQPVDHQYYGSGEYVATVYAIDGDDVMSISQAVIVI